jgi:fructosamine-3-kinase
MTTHAPDAVAELLGVEAVSALSLRGGDVADAFAVDLRDGRRVFAKTHRHPPPGFFTTEAAGLRWLRDTGTVRVPEVLAVSDEPPWLVLSWIDEGSPRSTTDEDLGRQLAALHGVAVEGFGRPDRRTTGSRGLPNEPAATWAEFYAENRLRPLARLARDGDALDPATVADLERLADRLGSLGVPEEPPSLVHGDLWGGNRLVDRAGASWLIDPAAHHTSREFDLAMMRLFGGFGPGCFRAYQEQRPLEPGWEERIALHQIAPLVVHAIKFGGGYRRAATEAIDRYV